MTATLTLENSNTGYSAYTLASTGADTETMNIKCKKIAMHSPVAFATDTVEFQVSTLETPSADSDWQTLKNDSGVNPFDSPSGKVTLTHLVENFKKFRMKRTGAVDGTLNFHISFSNR